MAALSRSSVWRRPSTRLGWWAIGLGALFLGLFLINSAVFMPLLGYAQEYGPETWWGPVLMPVYGIFMLLCGLSAGIAGLIAVIRKHERSWLIWLTILPGVFVLFLVLGEFLVPH